MGTIFTKFRKIKHVTRYQQLVSILIKYGFEDALQRYKISRFFYQKSQRILHKKAHGQMHRSSAERLRLALQEMGPTFIKFGQMLSTRFDLLPMHVVQELQKLQDRVEPFPSNQSVGIIEQELGAKLIHIFIKFKRDPQAAASLAQVHKATIRQGREVVVKVQRPNIRNKIKQDIEILKDISEWIEKAVPDRIFIQPTALVNEFERWIQDELDFMQEARNLFRFRNNFKGDRRIYVPKVFWEYTTDKVIVMEFVQGIRIDHVDQIKQAGLYPELLAKNGTLLALKQIFEHRFFHGDPHPGNLFVTKDGKIVTVDFGLMGRLDQNTVALGAQLLHAVVNKDSDTVAQILVRLNRLQTDINETALQIDVYNFIDRYYGVPASQLLFEHFFNDFIHLIKTHHIQLPRNLYLVGKSLLLMEYVARKLDENFNLIKIAAPYVKSKFQKEWGAGLWLQQTKQSAEEYADVLLGLPRTLKQIIRKSSQGNISVTLQHQGLFELMNEIGRSSNRLSFSLIIAALVIGSSLVLRMEIGPLLYGISVLGLSGYLLAGLMGLLLIFRIWRSERF